MTIFAFWILLSVAVAILATKRGRGGGSWFLIALLLSPLLGAIFLLVSDNLATKNTQTDPNQGRIKCPACAELVLPEATLCKHCGTTLTPTTALSDQARQAHITTQAEMQKTKDQAMLIVGAIVAVIGLVFFFILRR